MLGKVSPLENAFTDSYTLLQGMEMICSCDQSGENVKLGSIAVALFNSLIKHFKFTTVILLLTQ